MKEYLMIGQVIKPQGVRGEIKVLPLTDDPERFLDLARVFLDETGGECACGARRAHAGGLRLPLPCGRGGPRRGRGSARPGALRRPRGGGAPARGPLLHLRT